ncbi:hypothetical protein SAMN05444360_12218 [Chryseobacterium carnipullorum]|nr:hypothetical protein SAMN05444360_12218 [Chryseobacterium carnipullorum]
MLHNCIILIQKQIGKVGCIFHLHKTVFKYTILQQRRNIFLNIEVQQPFIGADHGKLFHVTSLVRSHYRAYFLIFLN